jgi:hypothetical protein
MDNWMIRLSNMFGVEASASLNEGRTTNEDASAGAIEPQPEAMPERPKPEASAVTLRRRKVWPLVP